jgi:Amiloride-sensitive sodium channel
MFRKTIYGDVTVFLKEEAIQQINKLDLINRNFLQLNIVLGHYTPYMMKDVPSMSPEQLWSSIGGVLSLWLGVTIMTSVEFIELLYAIVSNWYASRLDKVYTDGASGAQP